MRLPFLIIALIIPAFGFCQISKSKTVKSPGIKPGYFKLTIIETNSVLKLATDPVPFDELFYLKVKKPNKNATSDCNLFVGSLRGSLSSIDDDSIYTYIEIENLLPDQQYPIEITWSTGTTDIYFISTTPKTLKDRMSQHVKSQIGLTGTLFKDGGYTRVEPSLIYAIYYHFRPVNSDVPAWRYSLIAPQRFSYYLGLSINSLAIDNVREDLFGSNNLITGIGYQPIEGVRISYGVLFFNELNPNRILADNKTIKATSTVSITFDLEIKSLISGIASTLGFK